MVQYRENTKIVILVVLGVEIDSHILTVDRQGPDNRNSKIYRSSSAFRTLE